MFGPTGAPTKRGPRKRYGNMPGIMGDTRVKLIKVTVMTKKVVSFFRKNRGDTVKCQGVRGPHIFFLNMALIGLNPALTGILTSRG